MELAILLLELVKSMASELGIFLSFTFLITIMIWFINDSRKSRESTNRRLDRIEERQTEMSVEYQKGFEEIHKELERQRKATESAMTDLNNQQVENTRMTLRSIITNEALPKEYRMKNYDYYKSQGGNSWVDDYFEKYIKGD